ncbi:UV excision repair protein RAD23 homolog A-like [Anopheles bellator]|uniref:UV excision repair protein RAD23 homolog A-like n=1 Tax=Anopheles bellator TaxID=139047 RepID=UPI0026492215|nr:UV excision repair protein RAD23 homolog A-like [Anopheles bellator]XP_058063212.1 UV excision repair protein RAD23 homolog A-like [Anopheles bellator]
MKITVKTLKQQTFYLEVDVENGTVVMLKEMISAVTGSEYPVERQMLIYLGKVMEDENSLSYYNLSDKRFVVVMNKKTPPKPGPSVLPTGIDALERAEQLDAGGSIPSKQTESVQQGNKPAEQNKAEAIGEKKGQTGETSEGAASSSPASSTAAPPATTSTDSNQQTASADAAKEENPSPSTGAVPEELLVNVQRIKEMGYSEESAIIALEICANNPDRAVEYLLMENMGESSAVASEGMGEGLGIGGWGAAQLAVESMSGADAGTGGNPLAFLRDNPVFADMKRLLREDRTLLPLLMQKIQSSNPDLMRIITNNQEEFLELINESSDARPENRGSQELEGIAAAMVNSLTPSDMDAIDRLKALGYPEHLVIQAYIACERDEYKAAEFLVSQNLDDDD